MYLLGRYFFRRMFAPLAAVSTLLASTPSSPAAAMFANAATNGVVNIPGLVEASGIAASRNNPGVLWAENDAGNPAVVYAIDSQGRLLGTYDLPGNTDNEDIGIGPGPVANISYLYVADIGDNNAIRANIAIYQVPEPAVYFQQTNHPVSGQAMKGMRTITLTYPDGAHNAESEFIDPVTGDWFVLTKGSTSRIYTAPKALLDTSDNIMLSFVRTLNFDVPSGADISPLGSEIIVRQEDFAQLWMRTNGQSVSSAFAGTPISIPVTGTANGEPNGEAIGFDYYGSGYFTLSDSEPNGRQPLRYFARTSFDGPTPPRMLVPMASAWKFLANGTDQDTGWRSFGFDDSTWSGGAAQLGYGDGDEQTVVSYGPNASNKYLTTYFRKTFTATNVNRLAVVTLKLVVDDGAAIYLNGTSVTNLNVASDAAYNTPASGAMPFALRDTWQSFAVDPRLLREGTNTLAVEVHLASASGNSLSFDLQLLATEAPFITSISWLANQAHISLAGSSNSPTTIQGSPDFMTWTNLNSAILTNGSGVVTDLQTTNLDHRFYRAFRVVP